MNNATSSAPARFPRALRLTLTLTVGTVAAVGLLIASRQVAVLAPVAVGVALVTAYLAAWAAWAELKAYRVRAAAEAAAERAAHRDHLTHLHAGQRDVLRTVDARAHSLRTELDATKVSLGESQQQVSRLRGDNEALRVENGELRSRTAADAELIAALRAPVAEDGADVLALPRRRAVDSGDAWGTDVPTVVDLDLQRLASPFVADVLRRHAN